MKPDPKPEKKEKLKMTAAEFRRKYATPIKKHNAKNSIKRKAVKIRHKSDKTKLIEEADRWFSRRIRLEASDNFGIGACIDCGAPVPIKDADCGHFYSRRHFATRWENDNCFLQKKRCNMDMGRPEVNEGYRRNLISKIGIERFDRLTHKKSNTWKPLTFELEIIIKENKRMVSGLLESKGLVKWW